MILKRAQPLVKGGKPEAPVFAKANARDLMLTRHSLKGLRMNTEMCGSFFSRQQRLERLLQGIHQCLFI